MSATKRPGAVGLRRGLGTAQAGPAAATVPAPGTAAAGPGAVRTKPFRVTLDLAPADYAELNRWLLKAAAEVDPEDPRRVSLASALRAMIRATAADPVVAGVVLDQLRRERAG